ncbi:metalloprotease [Marinicauda pacifica]|uniref:RIP metalloprotease n=2 Tax=Alphaproteobacteria TaxID=28211 RepID=A0A4S2HEG0_9PROT|nr:MULTISPECIES: RIP metalloprotease [Marinicauda]TGY94450.1 RIP metalloprotease [Marinicauda pacifica]GGE35945.1 metalloprotease [Marinicauda pacifica]
MFETLSSGLLSLIAFVAVISFVVVIHELGHFWVGRRFGVHAEVFSIGFGPTLVSWTDKKGTDWRIAALPLGGYVRFLGDENAASASDAETLDRLRSDHECADQVFHFKPVWQRALIVAAGPIANFLLAILVFAALGMMRGEVRMEPLVGTVLEESPAAEAGFEPGDLIVSIEGRRVEGFFDVTQAVFMRAGEPLEIVIERDGERRTLIATPERRVLDDPLGGQRARGVLGVSLSPEAQVTTQRYSVLEAPIYGVRQTAETVGQILDYMGRLITGRASTEYLNGPIGIATTAGQIANMAVDANGTAQVEGAGPSGADRLVRLAGGLLGLSALLSVALGLMNLLPIPVLDGGHLLYYAYEAVAKRPPSQAIQMTGFRLGLALLLGMMLVATWNDISYLRDLFS